MFSFVMNSEYSCSTLSSSASLAASTMAALALSSQDIASPIIIRHLVHNIVLSAANLA